ncbi:MAG: hypothetical protein ACYTJ0_01940 [Planctomycetota bacterium]|jgi:hypothetical protein
MQDAFSNRRHIAAIAALASAILGGCAATPDGPAGTTTGRPAAAADGTTARAGEATQTDTSGSLAERTRRDVEAVLEHQSAPPSSEAAGRRAADALIHWNTPVVARTGGDATSVRSMPSQSAPGAGVAPDPGRTTETAPTAAPPAAATEALARPAGTPPEVAATRPPAPPATGTPSADRVGELLVELSGELYRQSAYADQPMRDLLAIAAGSIARPERALSPDAFRTLTDREKEILALLQSFFRRLGERLDDANDPEQVIEEAVAELRSGLIEEPRLTIADAALCYHVGGFGDYAAFDRNAFMAHEERQVILYLGIDDFSSELNQRGQWVTELSQQLMIYSDADGIPVWTDDWQRAVDVTRNQRQDFFTVQVITLPKALSVGRYHLKIRVRDEKSGAETETSIPFEMVADPKLAAQMP